LARCQWLTPVILATQEAEIRRMHFEASPRQIVRETVTQKNPSQKRVGGVAQGVVQAPVQLKQRRTCVLGVQPSGRALSSMRKALDLIPSTTKRKRKLHLNWAH
jgi:hypothetical protein